MTQENQIDPADYRGNDYYDDEPRVIVQYENLKIRYTCPICEMRNVVSAVTSVWAFNDPNSDNTLVQQVLGSTTCPHCNEYVELVFNITK